MPRRQTWASYRRGVLGERHLGSVGLSPGPGGRLGSFFGFVFTRRPEMTVRTAPVAAAIITCPGARIDALKAGIRLAGLGIVYQLKDKRPVLPFLCDCEERCHVELSLRQHPVVYAMKASRAEIVSACLPRNQHRFNR